MEASGKMHMVQCSVGGGYSFQALQETGGGCCTGVELPLSIKKSHGRGGSLQKPSFEVPLAPLRSRSRANLCYSVLAVQLGL